MQTFGQWLRHLREEQRPPLSQGQMADLIGFDQTVVSKVELDRQEPTGDFCIELSKALKIPLTYVLLKAGKIDGSEGIDAKEDSTTTLRIRALVNSLDAEDQIAAAELVETYVRNLKRKTGAAATRGRVGGSKQVSHT